MESIEKPPVVVSVDRVVTAPAQFDYPLEEDEAQLVHEFDQCWSDFLDKYPQMIPEGTKTRRVQELRAQLEEAKAHKEAVQAELESQLGFFNDAYAKIEARAAKETEEATKHQLLLQEHLQKHLDNVETTSNIMSETTPWQNFCDRLDKATDENSNSSHTTAKSVKPSARAFFLLETSGNRVDEYRAYQVDHALLKTQAAMLEKELERYEKATETSKVVGQFLTEHNIWSLMKKTSSSAP